MKFTYTLFLALLFLSSCNTTIEDTQLAADELTEVNEAAQSIIRTMDEFAVELFDNPELVDQLLVLEAEDYTYEETVQFYLDAGVDHEGLLDEINILSDYYEGSEDLIRGHLEEVAEQLFEDNQLVYPTLFGEGEYLSNRASCAWIAMRAVLRSAGSMAVGCAAGPLGCGVGGVFAAIEIYDATTEICRQCGCD